MYRDFSDASKQRFFGLVDEVENDKWCNFTDWVGDRWLDYQSWIGVLNIKGYINNVNEYHKKVIDKNNKTKNTIEKIFSDVAGVDSSCKVLLSDITSVLKQGQAYITSMSQIVLPGNGKFNVDDIKNGLSTSYSSLQNAQLKIIEYQDNRQTGDGNDGKIGGMANKALGKMGYLGNVLAFFTKPIASWIDSGKFNIGVTGASSVTSLIKDGTSTIKGLLDWSKSNEHLDKLARMLPERARNVRIKRLFGLNDIYAGTASKAGSWGTRFYNDFHKWKGPLEAYKSGGAKAAFAWAGLGLTAVSNLISNFDERNSGKISTKRAVAETITETVVDVGKGWLIGAAVTAGVAATIGSAPVLVVGAATVGISVGLDWACKKITGALCGEEKGVTETVSDFVLDVGEAAVSAGKKVVSSAVTNIKKGWFNLKSSFSKGFKPLLGY